MKNILIISLQFRVAHVAHLVASYRQMEELGYQPQLLVHPKLVNFLPEELDVCTDAAKIRKPDVALFWFPALKNATLMAKLKYKFRSKIIYVLHEPLEKFSVYRQAGLSAKEIFGVYARYSVIQLFLLLSDYIILPSKKALRLYEDSFSKKIASNYGHIPLLFVDDKQEESLNPERKYFSYIGTVASDHAFTEFVDFIKRTLHDSKFPRDISFMIATRNSVEQMPEIQQIIEGGGKLCIIDGHPLTEEEINRCYAESFGVWNAYHRTTQSGVLAKASMFGTPALVLRSNLSEFSVENKNVVVCDDNTDYQGLKQAIIEMKANFDSYSVESRKIFESTFDYKVHKQTIKSVIELLTK